MPQSHRSNPATKKPPRAGPHDPYCGFRDDRERRQALRNREVCAVLRTLVVACLLGLAVSNGHSVHAGLLSILRLLALGG